MVVALGTFSDQYNHSIDWNIIQKVQIIEKLFKLLSIKNS